MTTPSDREPGVADEGIFTRLGKALLRGDSNGGEIEKARPIPTGTIGSSKLSSYEGMSAGETLWGDRDALSLNLVGSIRWDTFERMIRDISIIAAGVRLIVNLIANAVWTVNPPENEDGEAPPGAQEIADLAYEILFDMTSSWSTVVKKTAAFRFMGFAVLEWTAKKRPDGAIGLLDIEHRPQRTITRWKRDDSGTVLSVYQRIVGKAEVELPRSKIVYAVDDTFTDHPEGLGLLRHLAGASERLRTLLELEEVGFETDLRGIPIARAPLGELQKEVRESGDEGSDDRKKAESRRQSMLRPFREFIEKHVRNKKTGMLIPSDTYLAQGTGNDTQTVSSVPKWAIELLNGEASSFEAIANAIKEMKEDLARILGVEHLLLGSDGAGSLALARSKIGTFNQTVTSLLLDLVEIYDRDVIAPLAELNGWPDELCPQMGVNEISDRDLEQIIDALSKLASAGAPVLPNDPAVGEAYDLMGFTRPPERSANELDASLNPRRKDAANPDKPLEGGPEAGATKMLKSRRNRRRPRRS